MPAAHARFHSVTPIHPQISDFVVVGAVEDANKGCAVSAVQTSLLPSLHNPRRVLLQPVLLSSDHKCCTDFLVSSDACVLSSKALSQDDVDWLERLTKPNLCTDFVVVGEAEMSYGRGLGPAACRDALLGNQHNPRRALLDRLELTSDGRRGTHFFIRTQEGLLCSTELTTADVLWFEARAGLKPGKLFEAARHSTQTEPSPTELPWEPLARYHAFARLERAPKGGKSAEHLANLRRSDPTISPRGQLDWRALNDAVRASPLVRLQQDRQDARAMAAQRVMTAQAASGARSKSSGRPAVREERQSADSVISFLDEPPPPAQKGDLTPRPTTPEPRSPSSVLENSLGPATAVGASSLGSAQWKSSKAAPRLDKPQPTEEPEIFWFEGVKYLKSADGANGYSSA